MQGSKPQVVSITPSTALIEDERETNFMTTSDYGPSSGASHPDSTSQSHSGSTAETMSTLSIPESQMAPSPSHLKEEDKTEITKQEETNISGDAEPSVSDGSQARLMKSEDGISNSSATPLVIEDDEIVLPGTPTRTTKM